MLITIVEALQSLAFPEMCMQGSDIDEEAKGTCKWLDQHTIYRMWLDMHQGLLWIKGKPGSGKSVILKHALQVSDQVNSLQGRVLVSFFFHGRGSNLQKSTSGLFRSILHQILDQIPDLSTEFANTFRKKKEVIGPYGQKWQWGEGELRDLFKSFVTKAANLIGLRIYIDALDECFTTDAKGLLRMFQILLEALPNESALQVCLSCRHDPLMSLPGRLEISMERENQHDIETYVETELNRILPDTRLVNEIGGIILADASGVFQWVVLVVKMVSNLFLSGRNLHDILDAVRHKPTELYDLYRELLRSVEPNKQRECLQIMQWTSFAKRPLREIELHHALAIQNSNSACCLQDTLQATSQGNEKEFEWRIRDVSKGLVEILPSKSSPLESEGHGRVQFIHQSVADFMTQEGIEILNSSWDTSQSVTGQAHFSISRTCVKLIIMEQSFRRRSGTFHPPGQDEIARDSIQSQPLQTNESLYDEVLHRMPFLPYATVNWIPHAKDVEDSKIMQTDLLDSFNWPSREKVRLWSRNYDLFLYEELFECAPDIAYEIGIDKTFDEAVDYNLLHVASKCGLLSVVRSCLDTIGNGNLEVGINDVEHSFKTALILAIEAGNTKIVETLLLRDDVDVSTNDMHGKQPLTYAVESENLAVVQALLARADIDVNKRGFISGKFPLCLAAENGNIDIVNALILRHDVLVNQKGCSKRTPLSYAAGEGHTAVVKALLSRPDIDINASSWGVSPLSYAIREKRTDVTKLLLKQPGIKNCPLKRQDWHLSDKSEEEKFFSFFQSLLECDDLNLVDLETRELVPQVRTALRAAVKDRLHPMIELICRDEAKYVKSGFRRKLGFVPKPESR